MLGIPPPAPASTSEGGAPSSKWVPVTAGFFLRISPTGQNAIPAIAPHVVRPTSSVACCSCFLAGITKSPPSMLREGASSPSPKLAPLVMICFPARGVAGPTRPRADVLARRLGQVLTAARRNQARQVLADEDGVRYKAMLATPAPTYIGTASGVNASVVSPITPLAFHCWSSPGTRSGATLRTRDRRMTPLTRPRLTGRCPSPRPLPRRPARGRS
jgi:hypothetical protein